MYIDQTLAKQSTCSLKKNHTKQPIPCYTCLVVTVSYVCLFAIKNLGTNFINARLKFYIAIISAFLTALAFALFAQSCSDPKQTGSFAASCSYTSLPIRATCELTLRAWFAPTVSSSAPGHVGADRCLRAGRPGSWRGLAKPVAWLAYWWALWSRRWCGSRCGACR
jgi:hypothetical protein